MSLFFICPSCMTVEEVARGDFWSRLEAGKDPRCSACATGKWHRAFIRRKATKSLILLFGKNTFPEVPGGINELPAYKKAPKPAENPVLIRRHPSSSELTIEQDLYLLADLYREHKIRGSAFVSDKTVARRLLDRGLAVPTEKQSRRGLRIRLTRKGKGRAAAALLACGPGGRPARQGQRAQFGRHRSKEFKETTQNKS